MLERNILECAFLRQVWYQLPGALLLHRRKDCDLLLSAPVRALNPCDRLSTVLCLLQSFYRPDRNDCHDRQLGKRDLKPNCSDIESQQQRTDQKASLIV